MFVKIKSFKKSTTFVVIVFVLLSVVLPSASYHVQALSPYENMPMITKEINIAQGKPVYAGQTLPKGWPLKLLTDGSKETYIFDTPTYPTDPNIEKAPGFQGALSTNFGDNWYLIDLQKHYKVKRVEIHDAAVNTGRADSRRYLEVQASATPDFSSSVNYTVLGSIGNTLNDGVFPQYGSFTIYADGNKAYRYIRIKKTGGGTSAYGDFKVFAEQTLTEVSKVTSDKVATSSSVDATTTGKQIILNDNTLWWVRGRVAGDTNKYPFVQIDLGQQYPVEWVEMEMRSNVADNAVARAEWRVYGSNQEPSNTSGYQDLTVLPTPEYTQLLDTYNVSGLPGLSRTTSGQFSGNYTKPDYCFPASNGGIGILSRGVNNPVSATPFRFLTIQKYDLYAVELSKFRAYVLNPMVNGITAKAQTFTVNFSDKMNPASIGIAQITVKDAETSEELAATNISATDFSISFDVPTAVVGKTYKVTLDKSVRNTNDVVMNANYQQDVKMNAEVECVVSPPVDDSNIQLQIMPTTAGAKISVPVTVTNNGAEKSINLYGVIRQQNRILSVEMDTAIIGSGGTATLTAVLTVGEGFGEGTYVEVFLWDGANMIPYMDKRSFFKPIQP